MEITGITNSKDIVVKFSPWTDRNNDGIEFSLLRLHVQESLYGVIPGGEAELVHSGKQPSIDLANTQETGTIEIQDTKEDGLSYKFNVFITKRKIFNEIVSLEFICIPGQNSDADTLERGKHFYTKTLSETYPNIWSAIQASYPGNIDKRVDTNISDKTKIFRDNETSYDFVKRLGFSWKNGSVFAFGWDGLLLKEIIGKNSFGDQEDGENIRKVYGGQKEWTQLTYSSLKYNVKNNIKLFNSWEDPWKDDTEALDLWKSVTPDDWYKKVEPKHLTTSITGTREYKLHGHDYYVLEENKNSCESFSESKGYSSVTILGDDMPRDWRLGDTILYARKTDDENIDIISKCIVASNELFYSQNGSTKVGPHGRDFEWTTILWGADGKEEEWSKELEENTENKEANE